jgi:hypothetical protein
MLGSRFEVGTEIVLFASECRMTGPTICRTSGLVGTAGFAANVEMGLFTSGYRVNGPRIRCRIGEIVGFGGLLATAPPEALGSIGVRIISSMIFVSATFALLKCAISQLQDSHKIP